MYMFDAAVRAHSKKNNNNKKNGSVLRSSLNTRAPAKL